MKIIIFLAIVVLVFVWYDTSITSSADIGTSINAGIQTPLNSNDSLDIEQPTYKYHCDGRMYCSQMTSCEEAKFFLKNCPNPKMDGDDDGIPCERQWCH